MRYTSVMRSSARRLALAIFGFILAVFLASSCATSRGSTYAEGASNESAAASASARAKQEEAKRNPPPSTAPPAHAQNTTLFGAAIVAAPAPLPPPPPPKGRLIIESLPDDALVTVDGMPGFFGGGFASETFELDPGVHAVEIRRFGYKDWHDDIIVADKEIIRISPRLDIADFGLRSLDVWPPSFNSEDPGYYGTTLISLEATASGSCSIRVVSDAGRVVRELHDIQIGRSGRNWRWDGRDDKGRSVADGSYSIIVTDNAGRELAATKVRVDSSLMGRSAILASGSGGTLFAPAARSMASGGLEVSSFIMGHVLSSAGTASGRILSGLGSRMAFPTAVSGESGTDSQSVEMDLSVVGIFHPGENAPVSSDAYELTASVLVPVASEGFFASLVGKFSYGSFLEAGDWPSPYDGLARFPGISLAMAFEYDIDNLRVFASPEIAAGTFYPEYNPALVPGLFTWGYLRGGLESTIGPFSIAASGALRSLPLDTGLGIAWPLSAGLEVRWQARESPLVLSFLSTGEFDSRASWYLNSGLSIGYRL